MIDRRTTVARSEHAVYRDLAQGAGGVVLHLESAAYHGMNEVGAAIWRLLADDGTFGDLVERLSATFPSVPPSFEEDIGAFVEALAERGLVTLERSGHRG